MDVTHLYHTLFLMKSVPRNLTPDFSTILCAEDDSHYALLIKCAMESAGLSHNFQHVQDGAEAMSYLKGEGKYADRATYPLPCVVLADLKMPRVNGFELIEWIRRHSEMPFLPVVILTMSEELRDIKKAYALGANSFLVKPPNIADIKGLVQMVNDYWSKQKTVKTDSISPFRSPTPGDHV